MSIVYLTFAIVTTPVLFFMLTWVVVTACRILRPEKPLPLDRRRRVIAHRRAPVREASRPVSVRDIREEQRIHRLQEEATGLCYQYDHGISIGVPTAWIEDLRARRN